MAESKNNSDNNDKKVNTGGGKENFDKKTTRNEPRPNKK